MPTPPRIVSLAMLCGALLCSCSTKESPNRNASPDLGAAPTGSAQGSIVGESVSVGRVDSVPRTMPSPAPPTTGRSHGAGTADTAMPRQGSAMVYRIDTIASRQSVAAAVATIQPGVLARTEAGDSIVRLPVYFATSRAPTGATPPNGVFGGNRDRRPLHYGVATVSIPPAHRPGELERPGTILFVFKRSENPAKHVVIARLDTLDASEWLRRVRGSVDSTEAKEMLVYVHGYNVKFDDAMRRAGQLGYDLGYENGTIAAFSWPSRGSVSEYAADAASAEWAGPGLERFLTRLADSSGAQRISVIAHSMGNRALASVLKSFATRSSPAFTELVLAAPDIDADVFEEQIAPILGKAARHSTLYVSRGDRALDISTRLHAQMRAGRGGAQILGLQELDVVDASNVPSGAIDHSYYAENKEVIDDIFMLVRRGLPPDKRNLKKYPQFDHAWRLP